MNHLDKGLVFFRVFDLSFFAPGSVCMLTLIWLIKDGTRFPDLSLTSASGLIALLICILGTYVFGLVIFSLMWPGFRFFRDHIHSRGKSSDLPYKPFALNFDPAIRDDLILYFWYLRAVNLGLAVALFISAMCLMFFTCFREPEIWIAIAEIVMAFLLAIQGLEYHNNVERCLKSK